MPSYEAEGDKNMTDSGMKEKKEKRMNISLGEKKTSFAMSAFENSRGWGDVCKSEPHTYSKVSSSRIQKRQGRKKRAGEK